MISDVKQYFELPICISEVECVTDCWIYNRLAILKTTSYYEDWLASHYELFINEHYGAHFGTTEVLSAEYHDEILERKQLNFYQMNKTNVIDTIKENILEERYVVMHIKTQNREEHYHEVLFYGFDEKNRMLLAVGIESYRFCGCKYSYDYVSNTIIDVQNNLRNHFGWILELCINYQYPATSFKINKNYNPKNCPFEAYLKLRNELNGKCYFGQVIDRDKFTNTQEGVYRGIGCLYALEKLLLCKLEKSFFEDTDVVLLKVTKK